MPTSASRAWTFVGLAIALFGLPAIVVASRLFGPQPATDGSIAVRELLILGLVGLLLWIVTARERLPLSSIGLRFDRLGRSVGWGIGLTIVLFVAVLACLALFSVFGVRHGEGAKIAPSIALTILTVFRAGIAEEVFYRGFALERLQSLTGSKWIAAAITLTVFTVFHYRQGLAGMFLALVLGAILTAFYLWKRDLVAAIVAHFLVDFVPNVVFPLFGGNS